MNCKMKRLVFAVTALFSIIMMINAADVNVNLSSTKQIIRGFGGSSAWSGVLSDQIMDTLYKNAGFTILRLRIDPNKAWSDEMNNAKKAVARGAIVFASPWTPPASMKTNNNVNKGSLKTSEYTNYANYLKSFVDYLSQNGVSLYAISLQNEPDWEPNYEGCTWTGDAFATFLRNNGSIIANVTKIIMPESMNFNQSLSDPTLNDATASSYVSIIGEHLYSNTIRNYTLALNKGKEIWETEHYYNGEDIGTIMKVAKEIHDCMVTGNMSAYVWWWYTNSNDGLISSSGVLNKRGNVLSQYAKYIRPGYHRVDATATPATNVLVSAYTGDKKAVIVAVNQNTSSVTQKFVFQGGAPSQVSSYYTNSSSNMATGSTITVSGGAFNATLSAQSITTFVGSITTTTATPPATPTPTPAGINGDVNGDGSVTIADALLTAQYVSGMIPSVFISANADVNCDGNIDIVDALLIAQYSVGLVTKLGCN